MSVELVNKKRQNEIRKATDIVARLLASENLKIIDGGCDVSFIDVKKREIHVTKFKADSPLNCEEVRLTSLSHEVGHALFTPIDLLHDKVEEGFPNLAPFINIVEDVRIERLIKNRFAGLHSLMDRGRKLMYDNEIFGAEAVTDPNSLEYINKFILAFKVGKHNTNGLQLTTEEDCILRYIEIHATDKDSVIKCAKLLYNLCEYKSLPEDVMKEIMEALKNAKLKLKKAKKGDKSSGPKMEIDLSGLDLGDVEFEDGEGGDEGEESDGDGDGEDGGDGDNEVTPNEILNMLLKMGQKQSDSSIKWNKDYGKNILSNIDQNLKKHVDKNAITATITKTFYSDNVIKLYTR